MGIDSATPGQDLEQQLKSVGLLLSPDPIMPHCAFLGCRLSILLVSYPFCLQVPLFTQGWTKEPLFTKDERPPSLFSLFFSPFVAGDTLEREKKMNSRLPPPVYFPVREPRCKIRRVISSFDFWQQPAVWELKYYSNLTFKV